jgi:hypothetical protein
MPLAIDVTTENGEEKTFIHLLLSQPDSISTQGWD